MSKKPWVIISVIVFLIFVTNVFTYKFTKEKINLDRFLHEIGYDLILLKGLDENKTDVLKSVIVGGIGRVFFEAGKEDDISDFALVCKYFTEENIQRYKKYDDHFNGKFENYRSQESKELNKVVELGEEKLINFCRNN